MNIEKQNIQQQITSHLFNKERKEGERIEKDNGFYKYKIRDIYNRQGKVFIQYRYYDDDKLFTKLETVKITPFSYDN